MTSKEAVQAFRSHIEAAKAVLVTGPSEPDGDSLGSSLAVAHLIHEIGPARVDVAGDPGRRYAFLPSASTLLPDTEIVGPYDVAIVVDGDRRRLEPCVGRAYEHAPYRVIIDHHRSTSPEGYSLAFLEPNAASTSEIVFRILEHLGIPIDTDLASLLYTGLVFDTGGFRHSNTSSDTLRLAASLLDTGLDHTFIHVRVLAERRPEALWLMGSVLSSAQLFAGGEVLIGEIPLALASRLGTVWADNEGIVDMLIYTEGVKLAVLAVERAPRQVKLSMRSRGCIDVASLARELDPSGGGHARAAGVMLSEPLESLLARLPRTLERALAAARAPR
jgi:bifunctional oligoribonuclease and PAP phosphatase NrnA